MPMSEGPGFLFGSPNSFMGYGAMGAPDTVAAFILSASANIAAGGENTTAQLTAPASGTFGGGRIQDDENPGDAVDPASNQYREDEWCMQATAAAIVGAVYEFRLVFDNEDLFDTYTVTPQWTIAATGKGIPPGLIRRPNRSEIRRVYG